jgi:hypothetical protein
VALLVGSLGAGGIDELTPVWPKCGHLPGESMGGGGHTLVVVVVVRRKMGWSQCVTWVQPYRL